MEITNSTTTITEPILPKDEFAQARRPASDEVPDSVEMAALREACQHRRLGRGVLADVLLSRH